MKYITIRYWFVLKSWFNSCTKALIMTSSVLVKLLFEKSQHFCNLYQRMLYWWNNCLKKKTHFTIYTKECCIGEITVWKKHFTICTKEYCIIDEIPVWTIHHIFLRHLFLLFYVRWVKMRADCSLCWYWWNSLPSLF